MDNRSERALREERLDKRRCFPKLSSELQQQLPPVLEEPYVQRSGAKLVRSQDAPVVVSGLNDAQCQALGELLPSIICGEESAQLVFAQAQRRIDERLFRVGNAAALQIAAEETYHESLLEYLQEHVPVSPAREAVRASSRQFFGGLINSDIATHFARLASLDGGVCTIFSMLLQDRKPLARTPAGLLLGRILTDERKHVRFAYAYAKSVMGEKDRILQESCLVRGGLVSLMEPCAPAFEALEVDADVLFARLKRVP
jgi:hypothetical protein